MGNLTALFKTFKLPWSQHPRLRLRPAFDSAEKVVVAVSRVDRSYESSTNAEPNRFQSFGGCGCRRQKARRSGGGDVFPARV